MVGAFNYFMNTFHTDVVSCRIFPDEFDLNRNDPNHAADAHAGYNPAADSFCISPNNQTLDQLIPDPSKGKDEIGGEFARFLSTGINWIQYLTIIFAVIMVILIGLQIMFGSFSNNSVGIAKHLQKLIRVFAGLTIAFSAVTIVGFIL